MGGGHHTYADQLVGINLQTSSYGGALPLVYGTTRVPGNMVDYDDFTTYSNTQSSGKGGSKSTSYTYSAGAILALCEGPITGINRVWCAGSENTMAYYALTQLTGTRPQSPWSVWQTKHPAKAVGYAGMALVCNDVFSLGSSATMANWGFEVQGLLATEPDTSSLITLGLGTGSQQNFYLLDQNGAQITDSTTPPWSGYINPTYYVNGVLQTTGVTINKLSGAYLITIAVAPALNAVVAWCATEAVMTDAKPSAVLIDFLTSPTHGVPGWSLSRISALITGCPYLTTTYLTVGTGNGSQTIFNLLDANGNTIPFTTYLINPAFFLNGDQVGEYWNQETGLWYGLSLINNGGVSAIQFTTAPASGTAITWTCINYQQEPSAQVAAIQAWCNANPATWQAYCTAMGFAVSPAFDQQKAASEHLKDLLTATNSEAVWAAGQTSMVLNVIPYGDTPITANGVTYNPNTAPLYNLSYDDFLGAVDEDGQATGDDPVQCTRTAIADVYNTIPVEWWDRMAAYNVSTVQVTEPLDAALHGTKVGSGVSLHMITRRAHAQALSSILGQRSVYLRNQYTFKVGWKYMLLEPMDLVTITDPNLGLNQLVVRIISVDFPEKKDEEEGITITSEAWPFGVGTPVIYPPQMTQAPSNNNSIDPGPSNPPVIFTVPPQFSGSSQPEIMIATAGGPQWGGCQVWVSQDGSTYGEVGQMTGPSRYGVLAAAMGSGDTTAAVSLAVSGGTLTSGSLNNATDGLTPIYIDGEICDFSTVSLTGPNAYTITLPVRGADGTAQTSHAKGANVVRMDGSAFVYPLPPSGINSPLWVKLVSFNKQGGGLESQASTVPYEFSTAGLQLGVTISNLAMVYSAGQLGIGWSPVLNLPGVLCEIRFGATWAGAQILGRITGTFFPTVADGTYWVAAYYNLCYSAPQSVSVSGTTLTANTVQTYTEAPGWSGACAGSAALNGSTIDLTSGNTSGTYTVAAGHIISVGNAQAVTVSCAYTFASTGPGNVSAWTSVSGQSDIAGVVIGSASTANVQMQIAIDPGTGSFGAWQPFIPGQYIAKRVQMQALLTSSLATVIPVLTAMTWTVSLPNRTLSSPGPVSCPATGLAVAFSLPFQTTPNLQITIANQVAGDVTIFPVAVSNTGFTVEIQNGGVGVLRNIHWLATGY